LFAAACATVLVGCAGIVEERKRKRKKGAENGRDDWFERFWDGEISETRLEEEFTPGFLADEDVEAVAEVFSARQSADEQTHPSVSVWEEAENWLSTSGSAPCATIARPQRSVRRLETERRPMARIGSEKPRKREQRRTPVDFGRIWLAVCLTMAIGLALFGWKSSSSEASRPVAVAAALPTPATKAIETIRVGERALGENPDLAADEHDYATKVDPATWKKIRLRALASWDDGTVDDVNVETLQPPGGLKGVGSLLY
jgi:hypothetical protein